MIQFLTWWFLDQPQTGFAWKLGNIYSSPFSPNPCFKSGGFWKSEPLQSFTHFVVCISNDIIGVHSASGTPRGSQSDHIPSRVWGEGSLPWGQARPEQNLGIRDIRRSAWPSPEPSNPIPKPQVLLLQDLQPQIIPRPVILLETPPTGQGILSTSTVTETTDLVASTPFLSALPCSLSSVLSNPHSILIREEWTNRIVLERVECYPRFFLLWKEERLVYTWKYVRVAASSVPQNKVVLHGGKG